MKRIYSLLLLLGLFSVPGNAQQQGKINSLLLHQALSEYIYKPAPKRKLLSLEHSPLAAKLNPLNYFAAGMLFVYQRLISEQIQANCNYVISCSEYTKRSIQQQGFFIGFLSGIDQLNSCSSLIKSDYPRVMISPEEKIINTREDE